MSRPYWFTWADEAERLEAENEALRQDVRRYQRAILELGLALKEERAFWQMAFSELEAHLREEQAA